MKMSDESQTHNEKSPLLSTVSSVTKNNDIEQQNIESNATNELQNGTSHRRHHPHAHSFGVVALCFCSFTNAFLVLSVFPYAGYMVLILCPETATTENVGWYAGWIGASFMIGRFFTAYQWGRLADKVGRIPTLQLALILSAIFSLLFGTSKSILSAFVWRTLLGMSNGILSTTKTVASEISLQNDKLERRAMGLVIGMRSWGLLMSPAIGGFLAEPLQQYTSLGDSIIDSHPLLFRMLKEYPFLLPNLVGAVLCLTASITIHFFLYETLESKKEKENQDPELALVKKQQNNPKTLTKGSSSISATNGWDNPLTRNHIIAHWTFSLITTIIDEAFPLFCMSISAGLGLTESAIGQILSGAGFLFAFLQYFTFATITTKFGIYASLTIGCLLGTIPTILMPLSLYISKQRHHAKNEDIPVVSFKHVVLAAWVFLSALLGMTKLMHSLYFTSMAVAINRTVQSNQRARMNALVLTGNSIGKAAGPIFTGALVSAIFTSDNKILGTYGPSLIVWSVTPFLGILVACQIQRLRRQVERHEMLQ